MQLPTLGRRVLFLALVSACVLLSSRANADPIRVATIEALWGETFQSFVKVDLPANPGAILVGNQVQVQSEIRAVVTFNAVLAGRQSGILRATFDWPEGWDPPFSNLVQDSLDIPGGADIIVFGMDFPIVYHPVPVTLTLSVPGEPGGGIIGPSTVTFSVVQPTPEPTSMALFGTGLGVAMLRHLRRKRVEKANSTTSV
jgi:PEP-CTERM motif